MSKELRAVLLLIAIFSLISLPIAVADTTARSALAKDTKTLRKYAFWCASNSLLALKLGRCDNDSDGISNKMEIEEFKTAPNFPDTDGDGRSDRSEILDETDPRIAEDDGGCYPLYFYAKKKITNRFNIPKGFVGSIPRGAALLKELSVSYPSIKTEGLQLDFLGLKKLLKKTGVDPMLTSAQIADLVAVFNRDKLGSGACSNEPIIPTATPAGSNTPQGTPRPVATATRTPTRTPTPLPTRSAFQWGYAYANTVCADCHTITFQRARRSVTTITNAIRNVPAMQLVLPNDTTEPYMTRDQKIAALALYLDCLEGIGDSCR